MTFASAGVGTPGHLAGEMLKLKLDSKLVHVPYKGAGPALNDVAGGEVNLYFPGYAGAVPLMQGGRIKMLAVSALKRSPLAPDTPTVAEATGLTDFDFTLWAGFLRPARDAGGCRRANDSTARSTRYSLNRTIRERSWNSHRRGIIRHVSPTIHRLRARRQRALPGHHQGRGFEGGIRTARRGRAVVRSCHCNFQDRAVRPHSSIAARALQQPRPVLGHRRQLKE